MNRARQRLATHTSDGEWVDRTLIPLIVVAYSESQRHYHTLTHLGRVLSVAEKLTVGLDLSEEDRVRLDLAILFHDVVYEPSAHDNELRSADMLIERCAFKVDPGMVTAAAYALLTTQGHTPTTDPVAQVLLDADLEILAAEREDYAAYAQQIRQEFNHVADEDFRKGRAAILMNFLAQEQLYTFLGPDAEQRAVANMEWEIGQL